MYYFILEQSCNLYTANVQYAASELGWKPYKIIDLSKEGLSSGSKLKAKEGRALWERLSPSLPENEDNVIVVSGLTPIKMVLDDYNAKMKKYRRSWWNSGEYTQVVCTCEPRNRKEFLNDLRSNCLVAPNRSLPNGPVWCIDIETNCLNPFAKEAKILSISVSTDADSYHIVSLGQLKELYEQKPPERIVGHNLKFDLLWLKVFGVDLAGSVLYDTMVGEHLLDENASKGLEALVFKYTMMENYWHSIDLSNLEGLDENSLHFYNGCDTAVTYKIYSLQKNLIDKKLFTFEMEKLKALLEVEYNGMKVDTALLEEKIRDAKEKIEEAKGLIELSAPGINPNSGKQIGIHLYEKLGFPARYTDKGQYRTDNETLQKLQENGDVALLHGIVALRTYSKLLNTYYLNIKKLLDEKELLHGNFNQAQVVTGRLSSSGGVNFQNIPSRDALAVESLFISRYRPGKIIKVDYSQLELRVLADLSRDENMLNAFNSGEDFHETTAKAMGLDRRDAKAVNFKIVYGGGSQEQEEAWFRAYPKARKWREGCISAYRRFGQVVSPFGRARHIERNRAESVKEKKHKERVSHNAIVQGMASDITMAALQLLIKNKFEVVNTVHDSIILDCPEFLCDNNYLTKIKDICENKVKSFILDNFGYRIVVKLVVDIETGRSWGTCS